MSEYFLNGTSADKTPFSDLEGKGRKEGEKKGRMPPNWGVWIRHWRRGGEGEKGKEGSLGCGVQALFSTLSTD